MKELLKSMGIETIEPANKKPEQKDKKKKFELSSIVRCL